MTWSQAAMTHKHISGHGAKNTERPAHVNKEDGCLFLLQGTGCSFLHADRRLCATPATPSL